MKTFLILLSLTCAVLTCCSQSDTLKSPFAIWPDKGLYRWQGPRFMKQEKTIGLIPSFSGFKHFSTSLSIAKGTFRMGEGGGDGNVAHLGLEYTPHNQSVAPKVGYYLTGFAYIFGANIGLNALYHFGPHGSQPILRPEIGYGLLFMYLNYGRNISFTNDYRSIDKHMFTLSAYFALLPKRKK